MKTVTVTQEQHDRTHKQFTKADREWRNAKNAQERRWAKTHRDWLWAKWVRQEVK